MSCTVGQLVCLGDCLSDHLSWTVIRLSICVCVCLSFYLYVCNVSLIICLSV